MDPVELVKRVIWYVVDMLMDIFISVLHRVL
jgi:hypothetical protein